MSYKGKNKVVMEWRLGQTKGLQFADWLFEDWQGFINYKYDNYLQYKQYILVNSKAAKYKDIKKEILSTLQQNPKISITTYAKQINIPFQTIYVWKNQWKKEGLL